MKSKKNSEWRTPHKCSECSEFDAGQRPTASGIEPAGWCAQCHGPVRPEAPACVLFERMGQSVKYRIEFELSGWTCEGCPCFYDGDHCPDVCQVAEQELTVVTAFGDHVRPSWCPLVEVDE